MTNKSNEINSEIREIMIDGKRCFTTTGRIAISEDGVGYVRK